MLVDPTKGPLNNPLLKEEVEMTNALIDLERLWD